VNNEDTFSVYYGQTFEKTLGGASLGYKPAAARILFGDKVFYLSNISDLKDIPREFEPEEIISHMNAFFHDGVSNVRVYSVINIVYIIRKLITRKNARRTHRLVMENLHQ